MKKIIRKREKCAEWPLNLPPRVSTLNKMVSKITRKFVVVKSSKDEFEVIDYMSDSIMHCGFYLSKRACDCLGLQLSGLPCKGVLACIMQSNLEPANYVDYSLIRATYEQTYSETIRPIPDKVQWLRTEFPDL